MTHIYNITGMTCKGCQSKVQTLLTAVPGVNNVTVDLEKGQATIDMNKHIDTHELTNALKNYPKYQLTEAHTAMVDQTLPEDPDKKSWFQTYKPILLIFAYLLVVTLLPEAGEGQFNLMRWMNHFMGGFFLIFSFFKLLDLTGFADSYSTYDIIARRWRGWGYLYAFIELGLGLAFLSGFNPILANAITLAVMSISIVGVLQSVLNKRKIRCACLGAVFNLPMSTVTIIEDGLMILMSAYMLFQLA